MARQIIVGKQGQQPFQILDPKVSRRHAILNIQDNGQIFLIDNDSTNGTYIYNGQTFVRIIPKEPIAVSPDSMIQLGPDTRFHVRKVLARVGGPAPAPNGAPNGADRQPPKKQPKKYDITHLRKISDRYTAKKMELESKTGMINGLRSCTILVSLIAGAAPTIISHGSDKKDMMLVTVLPIVLAVVLMIVLLIFINKYNKKLIKERNKNEHDYAVKYCCPDPDCHVSFRGKIYENILSERRCPRCKSEYYEKNH